MKRTRYVLLALLVVFSVSSCKLFDQLFYNAESVNVKDLADYTGTAPTTSAGAMTAVGAGLAAPGSAAVGFVGGSMVPTGSARGLGVFTLTPSYRTLQPLLDKIVQQAVGKSISYTESSDPENMTAEMHMDIENEAMTGLPTGASGTIEKLTFDVTTGMTPLDAPTQMTIAFDAELKSNAQDVPGVDVNTETAIINAVLKGSITVTMDSSGGLAGIKYDISMDADIGLSVSSNVGGQSGKYVITAKYIDSADLTAAELADPATADAIEVTVKIDVYDNNERLVNTYTYDREDLAANVPTI